VQFKKFYSKSCILKTVNLKSLKALRVEVSERMDFFSFRDLSEGSDESQKTGHYKAVDHLKHSKIEIKEKCYKVVVSFDYLKWKQWTLMHRKHYMQTFTLYFLSHMIFVSGTISFALQCIYHNTLYPILT
jgi:hypothetical protein